MGKYGFEDILIILIILTIIIIICIAGYLTIETKMSIARHMGLHGFEYWWYILYG